VTGSFVYNASTNIFSDVNVSVDGEPFDTLSLPSSSAVLTSVIADASDAFNIDLVPAGDLTNVTDVYLSLNDDMTDAGGVIGVGYVLIFECLNSDCSDYQNLYDSEVLTNVGTITAVPLPAAAWLFGSGLLGLTGFARRKAA
jgi:hypothetical protein